MGGRHSLCLVCDPKMQSRLLIVDDDPAMREALGSFFAVDGHACELAKDAAVALELVEQHTFDAVVSDIRMEGMDGLELLDHLKRGHPALPVILLTASIMAVGIYLPFSPLGEHVGMVPLPLSYFPWLVGILLCYCLLTQLMKGWYIRRYHAWL